MLKRFLDWIGVKQKIYETSKLSTKEKSGSWFISFTFQGKDHIANLAQVKTMSVSRMYKKMGELDENDSRKIQDGFEKLYLKRNIPPKGNNG